MDARTTPGQAQVEDGGCGRRLLVDLRSGETVTVRDGAAWQAREASPGIAEPAGWRG